MKVFIDTLFIRICREYIIYIYDVAIYTLSYDNYYTKIHIEKETALICVSKINNEKKLKKEDFCVRVCVRTF